MEISKESDRILCALYRAYLERRKSGTSKEDSRFFLDSEYIKETMFPNMLSDDIASDCWELCNIGYIYCNPGDDLANDIYLTDTAIAFMENRFKNGLLGVIEFLSKFIP